MANNGLFVLGAVAIIFGAGFAFMYFNAHNTVKYDRSLYNPPVETADWQVYTDEKYGFEIRYPAESQIDISPFEYGESVFISPPFPPGENGVSRKVLQIYIEENTLINNNAFRTSGRVSMGCRLYQYQLLREPDSLINGINFYVLNFGTSDKNDSNGNYLVSSSLKEYCTVNGNVYYHLRPELDYNRDASSQSFNSSDEMKVLNLMVSSFGYTNNLSR